MSKRGRDAGTEALADDADVFGMGPDAGDVIPDGARILNQPLFRWREETCGR